MTAAAEADIMTDRAAEALARDEAAVTLARDTVAALAGAAAIIRDIAAMLEATAEYGADAIAGGKPPKPVAYEMIAALQKIARDARGETATP